MTINLRASANYGPNFAPIVQPGNSIVLISSIMNNTNNPKLATLELVFSAAVNLGTVFTVAVNNQIITTAAGDPIPTTADKTHKYTFSLQPGSNNITLSVPTASQGPAVLIFYRLTALAEAKN